MEIYGCFFKYKVRYAERETVNISKSMQVYTFLKWIQYNKKAKNNESKNM